MVPRKGSGRTISTSPSPPPKKKKKKLGVKSSNQPSFHGTRNEVKQDLLFAISSQTPVALTTRALKSGPEILSPLGLRSKDMGVLFGPWRSCYRTVWPEGFDQNPQDKVKNSKINKQRALHLLRKNFKKKKNPQETFKFRRFCEKPKSLVTLLQDSRRREATASACLYILRAW